MKPDPNKLYAVVLDYWSYEPDSWIAKDHGNRQNQIRVCFKGSFAQGMQRSWRQGSGDDGKRRFKDVMELAKFAVHLYNGGVSISKTRVIKWAVYELQEPVMVEE